MMTFGVVAAGSDAEHAALHLTGPTLPASVAAELQAHARVSVHGPTFTAIRTRDDLDPSIGALLGLSRGVVSEAALCNVMQGLAASGKPIAGLRHKPVSRSLADVLHLRPETMPSLDELANLASGRLADGSTAAEPTHLVRVQKAFRCYGPLRSTGMPTDEELSAMAAGLSPDGSAISHGRLLRSLNHRPGPIAALSASFSAPKSVSVAWAFAEPLERALITEAHQDAVERSMGALARKIGYVRRGDGGTLRHAAAFGWMSGTHFTSRRADGNGIVHPGDMQLHDHVAIPSLAITPNGEIGKIDFGGVLRNEVKAFGALYQAELASALRRSGMSVSLDLVQDACRLDAIPSTLVEQFSKRTALGHAAAEAYVGTTLQELTRGQRVGLVKTAIQGNPLGARRDDVADQGAWALVAGSNRLQVQLVEPDYRPPGLGRDERLDRSAAVAVQRLRVAADRGDRMLVRTAATLGLIDAGMDDQRDIDDVHARLVRSGYIDHREQADPFDLIRHADPGAAAMLVEDATAVAVEMWISERRGGSTFPVQVGDAAAAAELSTAIRAAAREQGLIGHDVVRLRIASGSDAREIGLGRGDVIVARATANGRLADGRHGRVLSEGSVAVVEDLDDDGVTLSTPTARGTVRWRTLYEPEQCAFLIDYGYALPWPCRTNGLGIALVTEGSRALKRLGAPNGTKVLFDAGVEREQLAHGEVAGAVITDDDLWDRIRSNLSMRGRDAVLERAKEAGRVTRIGALMAMIRVERAPPRRRGLARSRRQQAIAKAAESLRDVIGSSERLSAQSRLIEHLRARRDGRALPATSEAVLGDGDRGIERGTAVTLESREEVAEERQDIPAIDANVPPEASAEQLRAVAARLRRGARNARLEQAVGRLERAIEVLSERLQAYVRAASKHAKANGGVEQLAPAATNSPEQRAPGSEIAGSRPIGAPLNPFARARHLRMVGAIAERLTLALEAHGSGISALVRQEAKRREAKAQEAGKQEAKKKVRPRSRRRSKRSQGIEGR